jgi:hypothetical protein
LNFGEAAFSGDPRWLEITINSCNGEGVNATLSPRVELTTAPYAVYALNGPWGTSDDTGLALTVNDIVALRIQPGGENGDETPNVIAGGISNTISLTSTGSAINGGDSNALMYTFYSMVNGGYQNSILYTPYSTIGGGKSNFIFYDLSGSGCVDGGDNSTIAGGEGNSIGSDYGSIGGGLNNEIAGCNDAPYGTIGGGQDNRAITGTHTTVSGGYQNETGGDYATVGGGAQNEAGANAATVGGGSGNVATAQYTTVGGGYGNEAGDYATTVGGGGGNTASGNFATVPGGNNNTAAGNYSFAAGRDNNTTGEYTFAAGRGAHAYFDGSFVWADSRDEEITSSRVNQFMVKASGGVVFITGVPGGGAQLVPGSSSWSVYSDRKAKENFAPVDSQAVLEALAGIPLETWNYKTQADDIRHIGPMAQDFYAAFEVGENDTTISTVDADGVALAAIQGLYQRLQAAEAENAALQQQVNDLEARLAALEAALAGGGQ